MVVVGRAAGSAGAAPGVVGVVGGGGIRPRGGVLSCPLLERATGSGGVVVVGVGAAFAHRACEVSAFVGVHGRIQRFVPNLHPNAPAGKRNSRAFEPARRRRMREECGRHLILSSRQNFPPPPEYPPEQPNQEDTPWPAVARLDWRFTPHTRRRQWGTGMRSGRLPVPAQAIRQDQLMHVHKLLAYPADSPVSFIQVKGEPSTSSRPTCRPA